MIKKGVANSPAFGLEHQALFGAKTLITSAFLCDRDGMVAQKRAAIYARVSTLDKGQDPETQLLGLRAYAARRGFMPAGEYVDYASGTRDDRPQYQALFAAAWTRHSMWSWSGATTGLLVPRPPWSMP